MNSFIIGMAKCMGLGGTLTNQKTIEEVIAEDWKAIGSDMFKAIGDLVSVFIYGSFFLTCCVSRLTIH